MGVRQRRCTALGLALLSGALLVLEVALARVHAAVLGPEIGYPLWAIALLSAGLGAVATAVVPSMVLADRVERGFSGGGGAEPPGPGRLARRLAHLSAAVSATSIASVIYLVYLTGSKPGGRFYLGAEGPTDLRGKLVWASMLLLGSLPFVLGGVTTAGALRASRGDAPGFCVAQLAGAALGCVAAVAAIRTGAPRAVLAAAVVASLAGLAFALADRTEADTTERRPLSGLVITLVLGSSALLAGDVGAPWLKASVDGDGVPDKPDGMLWTELGLITVDASASGVSWLREDAKRTTRMVKSKAEPPTLPGDIAYSVHRGSGPVLIVDAGGGRDVRVALKAGQREIAATVLEPAVLSMIRGRFHNFTGGVYDREEVRALADDGRGWLDDGGATYRHVVLPNRAEPPSWSVDRPTVPGLATTLGRLHTREAVSEHFDRLQPMGTLVVMAAAGEFEHLLALAVAALRARGVAAPREHLFGCEDKQSAAVLIKRTPLDAGEIQTLRRSCTQHEFTEAFAPDQPATPARAALVDTLDPSRARSADGQDLSPPTDDRPFRVVDVAGARHPAAYSALLALAGLLVALVTPLVSRWAGEAHRATRATRARAVLFLALLGVALGATELGLCRAAVVALGHPSYSLTVVVPALLVSLALGAALSARIESARMAAVAALCCGIAAALAAGVSIALWRGLEPPAALGLAPRMVGALAFLGVAGSLLGVASPVGLRVLEAAAPERITWGWGAHLVGRVLGATCAVLIATQAGFTVSLLAAAAALAGAAVMIPSSRQLAD